MIEDNAIHAVDGKIDSETWSTLSWEERRERRCARWRAAPSIEFADQAAAQAHQQRIQMLVDCVRLEKPARVPVIPLTGAVLGRDAGLTIKETMYNYDQLAVAYMKYHRDVLPDFQTDAPLPAAVFDLLGARFLAWPGHGVADDQPWQYLEDEYMTADEYDDLIADPSAYFMRKLLPRFAEAFAGLAKLDPFPDSLEPASLPFSILGFADPMVVESVQRLHQAAKASLAFIDAWMSMAADVSSRLGIPMLASGLVKAPYDIIADTLRGTKGIATDLFRRPGKILEAAERFVPLQIESAIRQTALTDSPLVWIPLHKGADGFMSDAAFREHYWPTLKAVILGMIDQGIVPVLFAEGGYDSRLKVIADDEVPRGSVIWWFDRSDMAAAKRALEGRACIAGGVPSAMLAVGSADDVASYVNALLEDVAADGGFILGSAAAIDNGSTETIRSMVETALHWAPR